MSGAINAVWDATKELMDDGRRLCRFTGRIVTKVATSKALKRLFIWWGFLFMILAFSTLYGIGRVVYDAVHHVESNNAAHRADYAASTEAVDNSKALRVEGIVAGFEGHMFNISGRIVNESKQVTCGLFVKVACLDANGRVVDVLQGFATGYRQATAPGEVAYFKLSAWMEADIANYHVQVSGRPYPCL